MKGTFFLLVPALLFFHPIQAFPQEPGSWGDAFDCEVDWFDPCVRKAAVREKGTEAPKEAPTVRRNASLLVTGPKAANLPPPVRNVLENPSPETARGYVAWLRQAGQKLAKASEYIAQAERQMAPETERSNEIAFSGMGPMGLYYFFSPGDESAVEDVKVLNKIWSEGRLGVVGIPVKGKDEEVVRFVKHAKPLFPIRRSHTEVNLVKPDQTPDLYLALPLQKKIFRVGPLITEAAITEAMVKLAQELPRHGSGLGSVASGR